MRSSNRFVYAMLRSLHVGRNLTSTKVCLAHVTALETVPRCLQPAG